MISTEPAPTRLRFRLTDALPGGPWTVRRLRVREAIATPYTIELELLSPQTSVAFEEMVGREIGVAFDGGGEDPRTFHGVVRRWTQEERGPRVTRYRAELVPRLHLLQLTSDCRIFQDLSVLEIVQQILREHGVADVEIAIDDTSRFPQREYVVQYRETAFAFLSRLLEEEGIWYCFRHEAHHHVLVLGDAPRMHPACAGRPLCVVSSAGERFEADRIFDWSVSQEMRSGRCSVADYDYRTPSTSLIASMPTHPVSPTRPDLETFEFPTNHRSPKEADLRALLMAEREECRAVEATGASTALALAAGHRFVLVGHERRSFDGEYVVTEIVHEASDPTCEETTTGAETVANYHNRFRCIPASLPFRPARTTPRPVIQGTQTAMVVGAPGEEIEVDALGRVKVQFHWDRRGRRDTGSSCWMRVNQAAAGNGFGLLSIPRVGQEVVVGFHEGDPDRPFVLGCVYNPEQLPPQALPGARARTSLRSNSYPGGGGSSEITMDDTAGSEGFYVHAQKDMTVAVGNDRATTVGNDSTESVANNLTASVGVNATETVGVAKVVDVGATLLVKAGSSITLQCGASSIHMNAAGVITISGTMVSVAGSVQSSLSAPLTQVTGAAMLVAAGAITNVTGAALLALNGATVNAIAAGDAVIRGAKVKIN